MLQCYVRSMLVSIHQVKKRHWGCAVPGKHNHLFYNHLCQYKFHHTAGRVIRGDSEQKAECPKARVCQMSKDYLVSEEITLATARIDILFWVKWAGVLKSCALIREIHTSDQPDLLHWHVCLPSYLIWLWQIGENHWQGQLLSHPAFKIETDFIYAQVV